MFLPVEGLFAEVIRRPGLVDHLQREARIVVTGPTTLTALLNSLQMGFRTLAIERRSSEVWATLSAVKTEFGKFGDILDKTKKKLQEATHTIDNAWKWDTGLCGGGGPGARRGAAAGRGSPGASGRRSAQIRPTHPGRSGWAEGGTGSPLAHVLKSDWLTSDCWSGRLGRCRCEACSC
jgi:hypothetical protein